MAEAHAKKEAALEAKLREVVAFAYAEREDLSKRCSLQVGGAAHLNAHLNTHTDCDDTVAGSLPRRLLPQQTCRNKIQTPCRCILTCIPPSPHHPRFFPFSFMQEQYIHQLQTQMNPGMNPQPAQHTTAAPSSAAAPLQTSPPLPLNVLQVACFPVGPTWLARRRRCCCCCCCCCYPFNSAAALANTRLVFSRGVFSAPRGVSSTSRAVS